MVRSKNTNQKDGMANSQRAPRVEAWRIIRCSKSALFEIGVVRKSAWFENQLGSEISSVAISFSTIDFRDTPR